MRADLAAILERPLAHRGLHDASRGVIENSMAAARAAIAAGFGIECDVQLSADGEPVVFHDEVLDRLTGASGPVSARPAADLAGIRLKSGHGDTIPTLEAFLGLIGGRVPLVIEIKSAGDIGRLAARTVALAAAYRGPVALKSFDPAIVSHCRRLDAPCPLGLVGPARTGTGAPPGDAYDFLSWNINALEEIRDQLPHLPLMSWTVRSPEEQATATRLRAQIVFEGFAPAPRDPIE